MTPLCVFQAPEKTLIAGAPQDSYVNRSVFLRARVWRQVTTADPVRRKQGSQFLCLVGTILSVKEPEFGTHPCQFRTCVALLKAQLMRSKLDYTRSVWREFVVPLVRVVSLLSSVTLLISTRPPHQ